jgi:hypothetical protein
MAKRKQTKGQTMTYKILHRKLKIEQHEFHQKTGATEGWEVPVLLVAPVMLLLLQTH